ncbi:hypothetical protein BBD41_03265 [Paenibacillus ihbetae]|uniref:DUF5405 domain-containing protein n=1 Tax=Paenibacillus ihbetae TaxID=1870820 RepID=A0A1B2DVC7_9BACL|nr:hypothetical protein [Paenibacillus ihbetae]ANY71679.1 hypothetical protein BBD41_03265 [Paenibacillus ihbetae]
MKVCIENNLYLESDGQQFIIKEYTGKQSVSEGGKTTDIYKTIGYFPTIRSALNKLVKMKVMDSTAQTLGQLLQEVEGIRQYIESKVTV